MLEQTSSSEPPPKKQIDYLLVAILVASSLLVVYLVLKPAGTLWARSPPAASLALGTVVKPITMTNMSGGRETIDFKNYEKPTVIYVVSPSCVWCARNTSNINTLASRKANAFHFLAVSLSEEGLPDYLNEHHLDFPIYKNVMAESRRMLGLGATPQTIVLSREGRVVKNWIGAFGPNSQADVEEFFGVQLPGLTISDP